MICIYVTNFLRNPAYPAVGYRMHKSHETLFLFLVFLTPFASRAVSRSKKKEQKQEWKSRVKMKKSQNKTTNEIWNEMKAVISPTFRNSCWELWAGPDNWYQLPPIVLVFLLCLVYFCCRRRCCCCRWILKPVIDKLTTHINQHCSQHWMP